MWQRFTEEARKAVFYAQEAAQRFGDGFVSTEHLLLGSIREADSRASRLLSRANILPDLVRSEIESGLSKKEAIPSQDMSLTPRAKRVIDLAYEEARNLNHNYIGTEHLLLGMLKEDDGLAQRVLARLGVTLEAIRRLVLDEDGEIEAPPVRPPVRSSQSPASAWILLSIRRRRMIADLICLTFLLEEAELGANALRACGVAPVLVASIVEEQLLEMKTVEGLGEEGLSASDIASLADNEAKGLGQSLNGGHFLLAALADGTSATARALTAKGVTYEQLRDELSKSATAG